MNSPGSLQSFHDQAAVEAFLRSRPGGREVYALLRKALFREGQTWASALSLLPSELASAVASHFVWQTLALRSQEDAGDGSTKALWQTPDGKLVESVLIRQPSGRSTLCVSSQIGCAMGCRFCSTGQLGKIRDLSAAEILEQASWAAGVLRSEGRRLRNVVFMGMGEPLLNASEVGEALRGLMDQRRFEIAPRHLSVSTCGVLGALRPFAQEFPQVRLALSLHAARQDLRDFLMPGCRGWPLERLMAELDAMKEVTGHRLFLEYILIAGVNDGPRERAELVTLLAGRDAHVNLIPYNARPGDEWAPPDRGVLDAFQSDLKAVGIPSTVRHSAGEAIAAACGQLAGRTPL